MASRGADRLFEGVGGRIVRQCVVYVCCESGRFWRLVGWESYSYRVVASALLVSKS